MYFDTPLFTSGTATARLLVSKTRHLLHRHRTFKWRSKQPFVTLTPTLALSLFLDGRSVEFYTRRT